MAIKNKPIQETGSSNPNVKVFPHGGSGGSIAEKSSEIEQPVILDDKGETTPVQENGEMPEKQTAPLGLKSGPEEKKERDIKEMSTQTLPEENDQVPPVQDVKGKKKKSRPKKKRSSKGRKKANLIPSNVEEGHLPIMKVNTETQTETEQSKQGADMKPDPEMEKESDIKEMSTQTTTEEGAQVSPGQDVKGKKKKFRPKKKRSSKGRKEANLIPSSVEENAETQTEMEQSKQGTHMKPDPEMEKERDIKEMSTQTPAEEGVQVSSGQDVNGKKKKMKPKKKRPLKEEKKANLIPSSDDDTQSKSISFQLPAMPGDKIKLVCSLGFLLVFIFSNIGVTQCLPEDNGKVHVYSVISESSLVGKTMSINNDSKIMCDVTMNTVRKIVPCGNSSIFLMNITSLFLLSKTRSNSLYLEEGVKVGQDLKYNGSFDDVESALKFIGLKEDQAPSGVPTESPHTGHATTKMPLWLIIVIIIFVILVIGILVVLYKFRHRVFSLWKTCTMSRPSPRPPSTQPANELELLNSSNDRNGPEDAATS